jgi:hypothetical protein
MISNYNIDNDNNDLFEFNIEILIELRFNYLLILPEFYLKKFSWTTSIWLQF